jgi:phosphatidylglycerol:prolipoprotein diacylglycerol transferase
VTCGWRPASGSGSERGGSIFPVLFRIGGFEVTSFGPLVAIAALTGLWLFRRELRRSNLPDDALDAAVVGLLGGLAGAKLLWVVEHLGDAPASDLILSRAGMSWFGGFAGGILAGLWFIGRKRLPTIAVLSAATPALAIGHAIGRIGCLLVGDDYGRPTDLPWGVAFPDGLPPTTVPVHPTQLYEAVLLLPVAWLLVRWRREGRVDALVFGAYLLMAGALRFAIEFVRINERVLGPLSVAHVASLLVAILGLTFVIRAKGAPPRTAGVRRSRR